MSLRRSPNRRWLRFLPFPQEPLRAAFLLPLRLREHAGLKKNVTIVGMMDEAQLWDTELYTQIESQEETPENVAEIFRTLEL